MNAPVKCPRCGHLDTFMKGFLSDTCVCRVCQSQLDWREVPGLGPDCRSLDDTEAVPAGAGAGAAPDASPDADLSQRDAPGAPAAAAPDLSKLDQPRQEP